MGGGNNFVRHCIKRDMNTSIFQGLSKHASLQAEAYVMDRQFARAIRAYLTLAEHRAASDNPGTQSFGHERGTSSRGEDGDVQERGQYAHVFRMIEQHSLFDTVQARWSGYGLCPLCRLFQW